MLIRLYVRLAGDRLEDRRTAHHHDRAASKSPLPQSQYVARSKHQLNSPVTSELIFELYSAPSLTFGIDSLFAFSRQQHQDGLAISLGNHASTVIPVVGGKGLMSRGKR